MADNRRERKNPDHNREDQRIPEETQEIWPGGPTQQDVNDGIWEWWDDVLYYVYNNDPRSACHYCTNHEITQLCDFDGGRISPCTVCNGLTDKNGCAMSCTAPGRSTIKKGYASGRGRGGHGRGRGATNAGRRPAPRSDRRPAPPRSDRRPAPRSAPRYNTRGSGRGATHGSDRAGGRDAGNNDTEVAELKAQLKAQDEKIALIVADAANKKLKEELLKELKLDQIYSGRGGQNENGKRDFSSVSSPDHQSVGRNQSSAGGHAPRGEASRDRSGFLASDHPLDGYGGNGMPPPPKKPKAIIDRMSPKSKAKSRSVSRLPNRPSPSSLPSRPPAFRGRGRGRGGRDAHPGARPQSAGENRRDARRDGDARTSTPVPTPPPRTDILNQELAFHRRNESRHSVGHNLDDKPTEPKIKQEPVEAKIKQEPVEEEIKQEPSEEDIKHEEEAPGRGDHSDHYNPGQSDRDYTQR